MPTSQLLLCSDGHFSYSSPNISIWKSDALNRGFSIDQLKFCWHFDKMLFKMCCHQCYNSIRWYILFMNVMVSVVSLSKLAKSTSMGSTVSFLLLLSLLLFLLLPFLLRHSVRWKSLTKGRGHPQACDRQVYEGFPSIYWSFHVPVRISMTC